MFLCLYKGIQWVGDKLKVLKDAEKYLEDELHIPTRRDGENKIETNGWTEMQSLPEEPLPNIKFNSPSKMSGIMNFSQSKLTSNQSMHPNDPMTENLLDPRPEVTQKPEVIKRQTGGSDTTSGCESGETESLEKDSSGEGGVYETGAFGTVSTTLDDEGDRLHIHGFSESHMPPKFIQSEDSRLQYKDLPRPPKLMEPNSNRAYVRSPEHYQPGRCSERNTEHNTSLPHNFHSNLNGQIGNLYGASPGPYLPTNGYTKAVHVTAMNPNSLAQRDITGVPLNFNIPDQRIMAQEPNSPTLHSSYVITSNSLSNPLPTVLPQLNHCNSLSSSTSGVSSNTPSSSQNNHHENHPVGYVAFSAVCKDDVRPVAPGYISVAQANTQDLISNTPRAHEEGYSRVVMPENGSGPPSLSAAYVQSSAIIPTESQVEHLSPNSFSDEDMYQKKRISKELSSLVMSPNDLIVGNRDDLTGIHSSYNGQNLRMQDNRSNHLNVIASLDGDRQSTMV